MATNVTTAATGLPGPTGRLPVSRRPQMGRPTNFLSAALLGWGVIILFFACFIGFGVLAPLAGGATAPGIISPEGSRRTVQHLEGGIINEILVHDGDQVKAGQPLMILAETQSLANVNMLRSQEEALLATQARLLAEQTGAESVTFPARLQDSTDPGTKEIMKAQVTLFQTRRGALLTKKEILQQRINQLGEQIDGLKAQIASTETQLGLIRSEMATVQDLLNKGLERKTRLLSLQREEARLDGNRAASVADVARAEQEIGETRLQIVSTDADRADEVAKQMDETHNSLAQVQEKLLAGRDVLARTSVLAPVDGRVVNQRFKTTGGVVRPGEPILDIVPSNEDLVIDARVAPNDIDIVHVNQKAKVHLSAFSQRYMPQIEGTVETVSADRIVDQQPHPGSDNKGYYLARVKVDRDYLRRVLPGVELIPGMPADVLIVSEERTLWDYLTKPFSDVLRHALHEV